MNQSRVNLQPIHSSPLYSSQTKSLSASSLSISNKKRAKTNWETQPSRLRPYLIGDQIGGNELSKIYSAIHCVNYRPAAIKMIPLRKLQKSFYYGRQIMKAEKILAPLLYHPHITPIYETIHSETHIMQIMELLENGNLYSLLEQIVETRYEKQMLEDQTFSQKVSDKDEGNQEKSDSGEKDENIQVVEENYEDFELTYTQKLTFVDQILSAVEYLHSHYICHRDIKLDNILLNKNMTAVKLCDFGFSTISLPSKPVSGLFGSYGYSAPEILENKHPYNGCLADMWSLGILIFVIFAERFPFDVEEQENDQSCENSVPETSNSSYTDLHCTSGYTGNGGEVKRSPSICSCPSYSTRNGTVLNQDSSTECLNVFGYFDDLVDHIDYSGIPDEIVQIIKSLLVVDPKKRASCHLIRQNPVFDPVECRIINKINDEEENSVMCGANEVIKNTDSNQTHIKMDPISERDALKIVVRRIAELENKTITKVMADLKSNEENAEKVLYRLIKNIIEFEGFFSPSYSNNAYNEPYSSPSSSPKQERLTTVRTNSNISQIVKQQTRTKRGNSIASRYPKNNFSILKSNSFSTLKNIIDENIPVDISSKCLVSSFKTIEEFKYTEILTVFGDPAKIMNDIDTYLIKNHFSVSYNIVGQRKAVALSENDDRIIINIEICKNNRQLDPMLYYDIKLASLSGTKEDFEDLCFFIKSRFSLPIFGSL